MDFYLHFTACVGGLLFVHECDKETRQKQNPQFRAFREKEGFYITNEQEPD